MVNGIQYGKCLLAPGRLEYQYTKKTNDD